MRVHAKRTKFRKKIQIWFVDYKLLWGVVALVMVTLFAAVAWHAREASQRDPYKNQTFYREVPGVDLASVASSNRPHVLEELNQNRCTCGCKMRLAHCRNYDPKCPTSLRLSCEIIDRWKQP